MDTIRKIFVLPPLENEYERQSAQVLQVILAFFGLASILYTVLNIVTDHPNWGRYIAQGLTLLAFMLGGLFYSRKGSVRLIASVEILVIWLVFATAAYTGGGIISSGYFGFLVVLVVAGVISGRRLDTIVVAILCAGAGYYFVFAETHGILPPSRVPETPFDIWLDSLIFFAVVTGLLILAMRIQYNALLRADVELKERRLREAQEQNRRAVLEKVIHLGKTVTEVTDFQTTLLRIWKSVRNELDFDRVTIYLYNPVENVMQGAYGTDRAGNLSEIWNLKFSLQPDDRFSQLLSHPDGFCFTHDFVGELEHEPSAAMAGVKEHISVAVWAGDKPVAVITVDQLVTGRLITEEQVEALRLFAGYAGLAIENAHLSERERSRQEMLEKVIRLGKLVTGEADYRTVLLRIFNGVRDDLGFDRMGLFIYDASRNTMRGSFGTDRNGNMTEEWNLEFPIEGDSFFSSVVSRSDGYFFTNDYETERKLRPNHIMGDVKYYAAVSAWAGEKPVAIICVDQLISGREITDEQLEALRLFAGYAGLAIENARLKAELEQRVRERTTELEVANQELESFSYSVSHDLRAPLRAINGFSRILNDDFTAELNPIARGFLKKIIDSGDKMGHLIDDLLNFSRLGRKTLVSQPVDMNAVVQSVLETLSVETAGRQIEWILSKLPVANADSVLTQQVYANLIGNAVKYSRNRQQARIEIGSLDQDGKLVYFVRDNGAGFDMQFAGRLFGVFQRLHREEEFEGTGIGLAIVQRIIQRHGGRVWAEAEVDKGATFYFTLG